MRLGYAPYDASLQAPGDRRRFVAWAKDRGTEFEVVDRPRAGIDVAVVCTAADLPRWRAAPPSMKVIYDITDDYLALPDAGVKNRARGVVKFLSGELSRPTLHYRDLMVQMCRRADVVVVTSEGQRAHVEQLAGHRDVRVILDCYPADEVDRKGDYARAVRPRLVWEGLPVNVHTLALLREPLSALAADLRPEVHVVTPPTFRPYARRFGRRSSRAVAEQALPNADVVLKPWELGKIADAIAACDVAVIPLPLDDGFARSKSAQKLVSLWAMGMPVVTSATPAYEQAMDAAGLDLACRTTEDWVEALARLLADEDARRDAAERGRAYVERHASRELMLQRWDEAVGV